MKKIIIVIAMGCLLTFFLANKNSGHAAYASCSPKHPDETTLTPPTPPDADATIRVAILLDASNSMDGLIDQAKSRLWNIVNTLTTLKYGGKTPNIRIALYMYGNDGLSPQSNYIRQIAPFTGDLDMISEKLFAIRTNGGSEYCGAVIDDAVKKLEWGNKPSDMKLIYIAGNEPFNQGPISYKESVSTAVNHDIFVNTIHCGDCYIGVNEFWQDGAIRGKGKYFCINSDERVAFIETPYDKEINEYNSKLNETYIYYGAQGSFSYSNQATQDMNAEKISGANKAERAVSKSKAVYKNDSWDLVDKAKSDSTYAAKVDKKTLPAAYRDMSSEELKKTLKTKSSERDAIQKEIGILAKKRQDYIDQESKKTQAKDDFGNVVKASIIELGKLKGYTIN